MAKHYFDTTTLPNLLADFKDYARVPGSLDIEYVRPAMSTAQNDYINDLLGDALKDKILDEVLDDLAAADAIYQKAVERIREPLAHLTYIGMLPMLNVKVAAGGLTHNNNEKDTAVPWYAQRDLKKALQKNAISALDRLLLFLEKSGKDITEYSGSEAQKANNGNFVNTFSKAQAYLPIVKSPYVLRQMRPAMTRIDEQIIQEILTKPLYDGLRAKAQEGEAWTIDAVDYEPLRKLIEPVELHFAFVQSIDEGAVSWTEEYGVYVPIIAEVETAGRVQQPTLQAREELARKHLTYARNAVNALKEHLAANAETYTLYTAPTVPTKSFIKNLPEDRDQQNIYKGIGL